MKKLFVALCCASVFIFFGCGEKGLSPEDVAKIQVAETFEGLNCDLSKLKYKVRRDGDSAVVQVSGRITFEDQIPLVRKDKQWFPAPTPKPAPAN